MNTIRCFIEAIDIEDGFIFLNLRTEKFVEGLNEVVRFIAGYSLDYCKKESLCLYVNSYINIPFNEERLKELQELQETLNTNLLVVKHYEEHVKFLRSKIDNK